MLCAAADTSYTGYLHVIRVGDAVGVGVGSGQRGHHGGPMGLSGRQTSMTSGPVGGLLTPAGRPAR